MTRFLLRRPSPAMIVAMIALFVALAGTGYAALKLPKSSVGAKQLKKNAVTAAKIKKDAITGEKVKDSSLTGKDIDLSSMGTVPTANFANGIPAAEATHYIGAPGEPAFEDGSFNFGSAGAAQYQRAGFYRDHEGIVHLQGFVQARGGGTLFSLPPGFRPATATIVNFIAFCFKQESKCRIDEGGDGQGYAQVSVFGSNVSESGGPPIYNGAVRTTPGTTVSLDGFTFRAES